ncbi:MAG: hypothetical protein ACREHV_01370, partial [Rhizomicrobium sp.]
DDDYTALLAAPPCGSASIPASPPIPTQDVISDLKGYFAALQAVAAAKDAQSFDTAAQALATSVVSVAKATSASTATQGLPALFSQLAQTAVQQAEYEILKLYVPEMDRLLADAATPITTALRVQQSFYLAIVTMDAQEGSQILNDLYGKVAVKKDPVATLTVYAASAPIVADFEAEQASARTDPATAFKALIAAHHALAQALQSDRGELSAVATSVAAISNSAQGLLSSQAAGSSGGSSHNATKQGG